jgi:hypothetical protein
MDSKPQSFLSTWYKPREMVRYLLSHRPHAFYTFATIGLILIYFVQFALFCLSIETMPAQAFLNIKGLIAAGWVLLLITIVVFTVVNVFIVAFWKIARNIRGTGSILETAVAFLWTLISFLPLVFFYLISHYAFDQALLGKSAVFLKIASYVGFLATLIYGFIVLLKTLSEVHRFNLWRSFFSILLGTLVSCTIIYLGYKGAQLYKAYK